MGMTQLLSNGLIDREGAFAALTEALGEVAAGTGGCIVVEGPAGIGKSTLLAAAAGAADDLGLTAAAGAGTENDRWSPLSTLLLPLCRVEALAPRIAHLTGPRGGPQLQIPRLAAMLADHAASDPLVVILDDVHHADEITDRALRVLVPELGSAPVLWLLSRRTSPAPDAAQWLLRRGAERLPLEPLDDDYVARLCAELLGAAPDDALLRQVARSGGNPFLVRELVAALLEEGWLSIVDGVASLCTTRLPSGFLHAVDQRLGTLSEDARRLLDAGAVFGRTFSVHEAAGLVGRSAIELIPAATEALRAGELLDTGSGLGFRHELVREAVYEALPGPVRVALHREAAAVLRCEGRPSGDVVEHLVRGRRTGDPGSAGVLRQTVDHMASDTPGAAADLVLRWIGMLDEHDGGRTRLTGTAVRLLATAGRVEEARSLAESVLRSGLDPATEAELVLGLCHALKHAGDDRSVVEYTGRCLGRPDVPAGVRADLLAVRAHGLLSGGRLDAAEEAGAGAVAVGRESGQHAAVVLGTTARSSVARARGETGHARQLARDAVSTADTHGGEARHWHPRLWLARALVASDRFDEADTVLDDGQRDADRLGTAWSGPLWHYYRAELRVAAGRLDEAAAEARAGVRAAHERGALALAVPLLVLLGDLALRRDDVEAAGAYVARAEELVERGVGVARARLAWQQALVREARGEEGDLADVYAALPDDPQLMVHEPRVAAALVRRALRSGDLAAADAAAAAAERLADRNPEVTSYRAAALHARGVRLGDLATLRRAVAEYRRSPRPLDRAAALEDAGSAADLAGRRDEAAALLDEAAGHYEASGCARDAARIRAVLCGRTQVRRHRAPVGPAPAALTEAEVRVVRLVAEGLTNRQVAARLYLSPHTVDSHLRHAFTKLDLNSRVELTRRVLVSPELLEIP